MSDERKDPRAVLEEAIKKRDELNTFIKVYQEMLGIGVSATLSAAVTPNGRGENAMLTGSPDDPLSIVFPGMFFGKTQPQAVKMFLEPLKPRPQKTKVLIQALAKGGAPVGGKKPAVNLWGVLNRNSDTFILVPKAGWGLVEWYEASVIAKWRKETESEQSDEQKAV